MPSPGVRGPADAGLEEADDADPGVRHVSTTMYGMSGRADGRLSWWARAGACAGCETRMTGGASSSREFERECEGDLGLDRRLEALASALVGVERSIERRGDGNAIPSPTLCVRKSWLGLGLGLMGGGHGKRGASSCGSRAHGLSRLVSAPMPIDESVELDVRPGKLVCAKISVVVAGVWAWSCEVLVG